MGPRFIITSMRHKILVDMRISFTEYAGRTGAKRCMKNG